ncbi:MAG: hypothetical protein LAO03_18665 [Acidobacteriia bacterium]|nr:hypothetical protein [Terriglobia bacterium]
MRSTKTGCRHAWIAVVVCGLALLALSPLLHGQVRVGLEAAAASSDSLSVQINSGSSLSIASLTPGAVNSFSGGPVSITTSWTSLKSSRTAVKLYAYFASATSALQHTNSLNTTDIPSSAIQVRMNGSGGYNPLSSTTPFNAAASGRLLFTQTINSGNRTSSRTDAMDVQLNLTTLPQLPADTYTGTLRLQAQATP